MEKIRDFFSKPIFSDKRFLISIWIVMAIFATLKSTNTPNNYLIFKGVINHTLQEVNLYDEYPLEHKDSNHYGPVFSVLIAPFAAMPEPIGPMFWNILMNLTLFFALLHLPIPWKIKVFLFYIPLHELYNCVSNCQTNTMIAALVIGSFICVRKGKEFWAACFIALGFFIKLYGIVGFCFFFFSKNKIKLIGYFLLWCIIFFALPMIISSPEFIVQSYYDWYESLSSKNVQNATKLIQDISAIGLVRRIGHITDASPLIVIIPGIILFALQYIKIKLYNNLAYQIGILASALLFIVLFSTGSESPTYVIAATGFAIWFMIQERPYNKWAIILLFFAILWTWFISSHMFPRSFRVGIVQTYSLKAVGSLVIWLVLIFQLLTMKGVTKKLETDES